MAFFIKRNNKKFDYTPRYYKKEGSGSPFEIEHKFDEFRKIKGSSGGIKTRFNNAIDDLRTPQERSVRKRLYIIIGVLLLIFLYIIDFDLSIFTKQ